MCLYWLNHLLIGLLTYSLTYSGNDVVLGTDLGAAMTGPVSEAYVGGGG